MDVNSVLQNTRQYFQGVPASSPASGELAPGASVGYSSPPVTSAATSTATSATNPYPPYSGAQCYLSPQQHHQNSWSSQSSTSQNTYQYSSPNYAQPNNATVPSANSMAYAKHTNGGTAPSGPPYHVYESASRSSKALPPPSTVVSSYMAQRNYTAPSITRLKEGNSHGMFNMDSIVCQPNMNYMAQSSKKSLVKIKTTSTIPPTSSSHPSSSSSMSMVPPSANVYKQSAQHEESRFYNSNSTASNNHTLTHPMGSQSGSTTGARGASSVMPHAPSPVYHQLQHPPAGQSTANHHQMYPANSQVVEQRVGYQHQVSYHSSSTMSMRTSIEKVNTQREPVDVRYYVNRRLEAAAAAMEAPTSSVVTKRDSPLDLSVKTVRQSADSTAHDEAENAAYGPHFSITAHQMRTSADARHPHLPQLPYANLATAAVSLPNTHNHSNGGSSLYNRPPSPKPLAPPIPIPNRQLQYSVSAYAAADTPPYALNNGQVREQVVVRHPVSEFRNEKMMFSLTYEQKLQTNHTQVNAQVSSMRFSQYYHTVSDNTAIKTIKSRGPPQHVFPPPQQPVVVEQRSMLGSGPPGAVSQMPPVPQSKPSPPMPPSSLANANARKRRVFNNDSAAPIKNPRVSLDWRENIDKEIENRLNAYTSMKAREEEEKQIATSVANSRNDSYRNNMSGAVASTAECRNAGNVLRTSLEQDRDAARAPSPAQRTSHQKLPFTQYLEQQKAQHKLPVQPIQVHPTHHQQWYANHAQHRNTTNHQYHQGAMVHPHPPPSPLPSEQLRHQQPYHAQVHADKAESYFAYRDGLPPKSIKMGYESRVDLKMTEKMETAKQVETQEQRPLPPFKAFSLQSLKSAQSPAGAEKTKVRVGPEVKIERGSDRERSLAVDPVAVAKTAAAQKAEMDEHQARAALMASALSHPRIRTKAELKQVAPIDKLKDKNFTESSNKLPEAAQNLHPFSRSQFDSSRSPGVKVFETSDSLRANNLNEEMYNHRPVSTGSIIDRASTMSPTYSLSDAGKSPRKRLLSRSEENGVTVQRSSSETTVFDFRSDSEPETTTSDLHSLKDLRKDRKTRTPSVTPTIIDQLNEIPPDDTQWMEACDELIQQFSGGGQKKRGRKKKVVAPVPSVLEKEPVQAKKKCTEVEEKRIPVTEIKKEIVTDDELERTLKKAVKAPSPVVTPPPPTLVKVKMERFSDEESSTESEEEMEKPKVELRGQRSNTSTTRIRIQNALEETSDSEEDSDEDEETESDSDSDNFRVKLAAQKRNKLKKQKALAKNKGPRKGAGRKKIDPKREKMRHMILRRMETRKSKMDAMKAKKARQESALQEIAQQPIMTRKMARKESLKETPPTLHPAVALEKKGLKPGAKEKVTEKEEKLKSKEKPVKGEEKSPRSAKSEEKSKPSKEKVEEKRKVDEKKSLKEKPKLSEKGKGVKEKSKDKESSDEKTVKSDKADEKPMRNNKVNEKSPRNHKVKEVITKKTDKLRKNESTEEKTEEDVTRRSLRSRNVVVTTEMSPKKSTKKEDPSPSKEKEKTKTPVKTNKKESKNEEKKASEEKDSSKGEEPTWEEELFKYKYSLRMPVKLINIARPSNWPKSNGGCSSLPDLDRNESDSDLLNECSEVSKTPKKKKNRDEARVSNTQEFKDSVKYLKDKFDRKIEEKSKSSSLTTLMMEKKIKIIPKSSDGPELLPTPSLDGLRTKLAGIKEESVAKKTEAKKVKESKINDEDEKDEIVEDSLIGYFRKETVDVFKEVFEKHKVPNQFKTVILESRTRMQTKEMKHNATLKQVFGCDRPASAPPVPESDALEDMEQKLKNSANGCLKSWGPRSFEKFKLLMGETAETCVEDEAYSKEYEDSVDFIYRTADDSKDAIMGAESENAVMIMKKKSRVIRRKCRSSGFDYIRKKKKQKKEEDDETLEEKEKKKAPPPVRPMPESIEDIQNEIKSWVVNKGIGETILHKAARLGYTDISSYCLEKLNCSPSPTDNAGYTPLHEACTRGHLKIAKMLLKYGADVSASAKGGIRPLHEAVENGNVELVRLLLAYGADPLLSTYGGQTPLSLVKDEQDDLKEFLLLYLADIQGSPSKPWPFFGFDSDNESIGYDSLRDSPPPQPEDINTLEFEFSDIALPNLYRFKNEQDHWILYSDLPLKIRDTVMKRNHEQNTTSQYVIRKLSRAEFEEHVECASLLEHKFNAKPKQKGSVVTLVKYNDKLMVTLHIKKVTMSLS